MRRLVILTVRNEGAFLLEWLAHHRAAGFTDVLVFSNDCADGTDAMLDRLAAMGEITHVPNPGPWAEGPQWAALKAADRHPLTRTADWIAVLDIDEFVAVRTGDGTLAALEAALPEATAITLTWRLFGNCGIRSFEDRPVTEIFRRAAPRLLWWPWRAAIFKTLFRNDGCYGKLGVHRPRNPDRARLAGARWFDGSGRPLGPAFATRRIFSDYGRDNHALVQLNHYALGAMESYVLKCDRGRANREGAYDMGYWVERNFCDEADDAIDRLATPRTARLAALKADPVLARLHAAAVDWRRARFAELMQDEAARTLFGRLMMTPPARALPRAEAEIVIAHALRARAAEAGGD